MSKELLEKYSTGLDPSADEIESFILEALGSESEASGLSDWEIGAFLMATSLFVPRAEELIGGARGLRANMLEVETPSNEAIIVDTCGTGGSGLDTFCTSTASAFVAVGGGLSVAKHGNRAASGRAGSADVLEKLGLDLEALGRSPGQCLEETGFCFMFAPLHHPATRRVVQARKKLGLRTLFNFLGPLSNPAGVKHQVVGCSALEVCKPMAEALGRLGSERAIVVRGVDGLDEFTLTGPSQVFELVDGDVREYIFEPESLGLSTVELEEISGLGAEGNAETLRELLSGKQSPYRDLVCLNSAASFYVSGAARSFEEGLEIAYDSIDSGRAAEVLEQVRSFTNQS